MVVYAISVHVMHHRRIAQLGRLARCATSSSTAAGSSAGRSGGASSTSPVTCPERAFSTSTPTWRRPPGAGGRHPLPAADAFTAAASRAGIGAGVFVVAYGGMGGAERLWWLLRHFGHDDCAVLELDAWRGPLRTGEETPAPAEFVATPRTDDTVGADELAGRLGEPGLVVRRRARCPRGIAARRTRSTASRAASPARSTRRGTSHYPTTSRPVRWSPTAAPA